MQPTHSGALGGWEDTDGLPGGIEAAACRLEVLDEFQNGLHSQGQVSPVRVESLFGNHTPVLYSQQGWHLVSVRLNPFVWACGSNL